MRFVDEIDFVIRSGSGGDGAISFRREKYVPRGGPDGGDGGRGGKVILEATRQRNTLVDYRRNKVYAAQNGQPGGGQRAYGRSGDDLVLEVPVGTIVSNAETGDLLADLADAGDQWEIRGGKGGAGNVHFKSSTHRTPRKSEPGEEGTELRVRLELKLIADVGLLGFPNAGKSTLISTISAARPKVAEYPFTTLVPSLGVVKVGDGSVFVVADIPGLIEGAAEGVGLGHQFLRHVERCSLYVHLVSASDPTSSPADRYIALMRELERYDASVAAREQLIVLSQIDTVTAEEAEAMRTELAEASGRRVYAISSVSHVGLRPMLAAIWEVVQRDRQAREAREADEEQE
ncbi:MAG: GTP-binding protein [Myxococcota bacterium]|jgi:GTP-binding protein